MVLKKIVLILLLASPLAVVAQLKEMILQLEAPETEQELVINTSPTEALLVVYTDVPELDFASSPKGVIRVEREPGFYIVHLEPGTNNITFSAPQYAVLKEPIYIAQRAVKHISIKTKEEPPPLPPLLGKGTIIIETNPPGAKVTLNNVLLAQATPVELKEQLTGEHKVKLEMEEYIPLDTLVKCEKDKSLTYKFRLLRNIAFLTLESDPSGAETHINGNIIGNTPIYSRELRPGNYSIKIQKDKYNDYINEITLGVEETRVLTPRLIPQVGTLKLDCVPPQAKIYLDGRLLGNSPQTVKDLPIGKYKTLFKLPEYADYENEVTIRNRQESKVSARLSKTAYLEKLKRRRTAMGLSLIAPGTGQIYSQQRIKGSVYLGSFILSGLISFNYYNEYNEAKKDYDRANLQYFSAGSQSEANSAFAQMQSAYHNLQDFDQAHKLFLIASAGIWAWNIIDCYLWGGGRAVTYSLNSNGVTICYNF